MVQGKGGHIAVTPTEFDTAISELKRTQNIHHLHCPFTSTDITIMMTIRVLTMVYNTQNYWVFGLFPSSGILQTRKHNVSKTVSLSVLR
jgi:hypothetical protein